ncbi:MAG: hypothetical protein HC888_11750 [Candidatus Competibacteraceae bacterium]|nr:hypothetical protein [Candidatus Competibacteraceae bacterium]
MISWEFCGAGRTVGVGATRSARIEADGFETQDRFGVTVRADNDTRFEAVNLGTVAGADLLFEDLSIHRTGDVDWFRFTTAGVGTAADGVSISFAAGTGDLSLVLHDAAGIELNRSATDGTVERVSLDGLSAGTYLVEVRGANETVTNPDYTLEIDAPAATARTGGTDVAVVAADHAEGVSGNNSAAKATSLGTIGVNDKLPTITGLTIHAGDLAGVVTGTVGASGGDWYVLEATRGTDLNPNAIVVGNAGPADGNLDLYVYGRGSDGNLTLLGSSATDNPSESVSFPEVVGDIYIQVVGQDGDAINDGYTLDIARRLYDMDGNGRADALTDGLIGLATLFDDTGNHARQQPQSGAWEGRSGHTATRSWITWTLGPSRCWTSTATAGRTR